MMIRTCLAGIAVLALWSTAASAQAPGPVVASETSARQPDDKDEIKYEMDDLEKNHGIKFKSAKLGQKKKKTGSDTQITITLVFTKDLKESTIAELGGNGQVRKLLPVRDLFTGKKGQDGKVMQCCFFDEDGVVISKQPPGKVEGVISGKEGDAFRITQSVPTDVLAKTKKISFREESPKK